MKNIVVIFLILFLDLIAFTIILPLFPSIIDYYDDGNTDSAHSDGQLEFIHQIMDWIRTNLSMPDRRRYNSVLVGGILGSLFSFLQFLSSPVIGACSDVFGRKKMLILSMIGTTLSYAVWWKAETFSIFLLSRVIGGLAKGSVTLCTAMMSDVTTHETRGKGMAFIGLSFSFGFITGPLIGAFFASKFQHDSHVVSTPFAQPALIAVFFQLLAMLLVIFACPETLSSKNKQPVTTCFSRAFRLINPINLFTTNKSKSSTLQKLLITNFLYLLFFSGLEFTLTFVTHERFSFTSMEQGKLFFFAGLVMMAVQGGYVRRVKLNREKNIAMQGIVVIIPAMILISLAKSVQLTYLALLLYSFGAGTVVPCLTALFTQHSEDNETGENIGIFRSAGALARAIAPAVTCSVYWSFGSTICYFIGAFMFLIPLALLTTTDVTKKLEKKTE